MYKREPQRRPTAMSCLLQCYNFCTKLPAVTMPPKKRVPNVFPIRLLSVYNNIVKNLLLHHHTMIPKTTNDYKNFINILVPQRDLGNQLQTMGTMAGQMPAIKNLSIHQNVVIKLYTTIPSL